MKREVSFVLSAAVLAVLVAFAMPSLSWGKEKKESSGQLRWHGQVVRKSADGSALSVRKGNVEKEIHISSTTKWTKSQGDKVVDIDPSEVKEGSDVICLGKANEKGEFEATRIDLRLPR